MINSATSLEPRSSDMEAGAISDAKADGFPSSPWFVPPTSYGEITEATADYSGNLLLAPGVYEIDVDVDALQRLADKARDAGDYDYVPEDDDL